MSVKKVIGVAVLALGLVLPGAAQKVEIEFWHAATGPWRPR